MDRAEQAWAAGFWDGEGSAWLTRPQGRSIWRPQARINQASTTGVPEVLHRFRAVVGVGAIHGPETDDGREPIYRWTASSRADIERTYQVLRPWLGVVKQAQFCRALGVAPEEAADFDTATADERRAWCAGLWDGEGSVCLLKHRSHAGHLVLEASVTQSSADDIPEVLQRLRSLAHGGFIYGPFAQEAPRLPVYRWKLFRRDEIGLLIAASNPGSAW